eukprot:CAMPEP_0178385154 /NCGR_PEP_ID=MMETSP0689_2-20121128/7888_1 /TAXON_ID=160604 /ORGANISM="Amphidinium massartii, Strain CS-259" /LENGTH=502 /DNA_ID=CAMNT_0020005431 /DNA_START=96 /DNA_END=1601 /DNA_ORIENTATION=+
MRPLFGADPPGVIATGLTDLRAVLNDTVVVNNTADADLLRDGCAPGGCMQSLPPFFPLSFCMFFTGCLASGFVLYLATPKAAELAAGFFQALCVETTDRSSDAPEVLKGAVRSPFVDNCKFLLVFLVVVLHSITHVWPGKLHPDGDASLIILSSHTWVEVIVVPMFAFVSGLVSNGNFFQNAKIRGSIERIVAPYLLCNFLLYGFDFQSLKVTGGFWSGAIFADPVAARGVAPHMWYLEAWLIWQIINCGFLQPLRAPAMIAIAYAVSWICGYWSLGYVGASTMAHLCYHATGVLVPLPKFIAFCSNPWVRCGALLVFISQVALHLSLAGSALDSDNRDFMLWQQGAIRWSFFGSGGGASLLAGDSDQATLYYTAWMQRATAQFLLVWPAGLACLCLVPQRRTFFSEWGANTMYPYVLHWAVLMGLYPMHLAPWSDWAAALALGHEPDGFALLIVADFALTAVLASSITRCWARVLLAPEWLRCLFASDSEGKSEPGAQADA